MLDAPLRPDRHLYSRYRSNIESSVRTPRHLLRGRWLTAARERTQHIQTHIHTLLSSPWNWYRLYIWRKAYMVHLLCIFSAFDYYFWFLVIERKFTSARHHARPKMITLNTKNAIRTKRPRLSLSLTHPAGRDNNHVVCVCGRTQPDNTVLSGRWNAASMSSTWTVLSKSVNNNIIRWWFWSWTPLRRPPPLPWTRRKMMRSASGRAFWECGHLRNVRVPPPVGWLAWQPMLTHKHTHRAVNRERQVNLINWPSVWFHLVP